MYSKKYLCKPFFVFILSTILVLISIFGQQLSVHAADTATTLTANIYHVHTGSSSGGGCYTVPYTSWEAYEEECTGHLIYYPDYDVTQCDGCGAGYSGQVSGRCPHSETKYRSTTSYSLGCGLGNSSVIGYFYVSKNTDEWATSVTLEMSYSGNVSVGSTPYSVNGTPTFGSFTVTENGNYNVVINTTGNSGGGSIVMPITNIDHTGPQITAYSLNPDEWTTSDVVFSADTIVDNQPDGSSGCGLADDFISYDNGASWSHETTHAYNDNGTYTILVKDKLDNTSSTVFTIENIDREAPNITSVEYDSTTNIRTTTVVVTADDIRADGSPGVGLHEEAYSFDNGQSWSSDNTLELSENTTVKIAVRDKLENIAYYDLIVSNIDCYGPTISYGCWPDYITDKDVDVSFYANDINPDGSPGVGLPPLYFSYDNGVTWTDESRYTFTSNGSIRVLARDLHGNVSEITAVVDWIDRSGDNDEGEYIVHNPSPSATPIQDVVPKKEHVKKAKDTPTPTPVLVEKQITAPKKEKPVLNSKTDNVVEVHLEDTPTNEELTFGRILAIILGILALLGLLALLLFFLFGLVRIYCLADSKQYKLVGISRVRHKNDLYEINISESVIEACESTVLRLKLPPFFSALHEDENIIIYLPDNQSYDEQVNKVIDITFKVVK